MLTLTHTYDLKARKFTHYLDIFNSWQNREVNNQQLIT